MSTKARIVKKIRRHCKGFIQIFPQTYTKASCADALKIYDAVCRGYDFVKIRHWVGNQIKRRIIEGTTVTSWDDWKNVVRGWK